MELGRLHGIIIIDKDQDAKSSSMIKRSGEYVIESKKSIVHKDIIGYATDPKITIYNNDDVVYELTLSGDYAFRINTIIDAMNGNEEKYLLIWKLK